MLTSLIYGPQCLEMRTIVEKLPSPDGTVRDRKDEVIDWTSDFRKRME